MSDHAAEPSVSRGTFLTDGKDLFEIAAVVSENDTVRVLIVNARAEIPPLRADIRWLDEAEVLREFRPIEPQVAV